MNFATGIFGAFVFFFLWRGYQKGFIGSITRIAAWLIAYPAAIYLTNPVAKLIFKHSSLDGMIVYFIAGSLIFLLVSLSVTKLLNSFSSDKSDEPDEKSTNNLSKIGGAIVGSIFGGVVGLLAVYAIDISKPPITTDARNAAQKELLYTPEENNSAKKFPQHEDSFIDSSAKKMVGAVAATVVDLTLKDSTATNLTKAFAENPQTMLGHIQQLSNDGQIKNLLADSTIQELLTKGDTTSLLNNQDFQSLMNNADMQAILQSVEEDKSGKTQQELAAEKMVAAWQRTNAIKNDPRVIAIVTDPEFQQQLNSTNKLPLLTNPKLKILTELIFTAPSAIKNEQATPMDESTPTESKQNHYEIKDISNADNNLQSLETENKQSTEEKAEKKIYRWTDKNGNIHYSDNPTID